MLGDAAAVPLGGELGRWARRVAASPAGLAAALAALAWALGLHGTDQAAQVFRVLEVRRHGLALLDGGWYGGIYPLSYSVVFPLVGAAVGLAASAVATCTAAAWAFDRLVVRHLGARPAGSWYFAASTLLQVAIGQLPFLAGEALGLLAVLALGSRRRVLAAALAVGAALCSPLAAAFLAMACLAWGWRLRGSDRTPVALALLAMAVVGLLAVAFPGDGAFPFPWTELVVVELLCAAVASPLVRTTPAVRVAVGLYAVASLAAFVVPNPLGGNAGRLGSAVGVPLLACFATAPAAVRPRLTLAGGAAWRTGRAVAAHLGDRWQRWAAAALVPFAVWQWAPGVHAVIDSQRDPATAEAFYAPLVARLRTAPLAASRIEIVPTAEHWEAAYVATAGLSLARGWERQIDTARNPLFYRPGLLTPASYRAWLLGAGVSWVALPRTHLDYAGVAEAALLRSGRVPGLRRVWRSADWELWSVRGSPGLVSGPAALTGLAPDHVDLLAAAAGAVTVRIRYTSYWTLPPGAGCVAPDPAGWTVVQVARPGPIDLAADLRPVRGPVCATPPSP